MVKKTIQKHFLVLWYTCFVLEIAICRNTLLVTISHYFFKINICFHLIFFIAINSNKVILSSEISAHDQNALHSKYRPTTNICALYNYCYLHCCQILMNLSSNFRSHHTNDLDNLLDKMDRILIFANCSIAFWPVYCLFGHTIYINNYKRL